MKFCKVYDQKDIFVNPLIENEIYVFFDPEGIAKDFSICKYLGNGRFFDMNIHDTFTIEDIKRGVAHDYCVDFETAKKSGLIKRRG
jgi:hypothetical protein